MYYLLILARRANVYTKTKKSFVYLTRIVNTRKLNFMLTIKAVWFFSLSVFIFVKTRHLTACSLNFFVSLLFCRNNINVIQLKQFFIVNFDFQNVSELFDQEFNIKTFYVRYKSKSHEI